MRASLKTPELPRDVTHPPFDEYGLPLILEPATPSLAKDPIAMQSWFEEHHRTVERSPLGRLTAADSRSTHG